MYDYILLKNRLLSLSKYDRMFKTYIPDHYGPIKYVCLPNPLQAIHVMWEVFFLPRFWDLVLFVGWANHSEDAFILRRGESQRTNRTGIRNKILTPIWHPSPKAARHDNMMICLDDFLGEEVLQGRICLQRVTIL